MSTGRVTTTSSRLCAGSFWCSIFCATAALLMFVAEPRILRRSGQIEQRQQAQALVANRGSQSRTAPSPGSITLANGFRGLRLGLVITALVAYVVFLTTRRSGRLDGDVTG